MSATGTCRSCGLKDVPVCVTTPADLSCSGRESVAIKRIDACIADIVEALDEAGITMRHSCCGHGEAGDIMLHDGRTLLIQRSVTAGGDDD